MRYSLFETKDLREMKPHKDKGEAVDPIFRVDGCGWPPAALVHHDRRRPEAFVVPNSKEEAPHGSGMDTT
jgi:hypothetical protein